MGIFRITKQSNFSIISNIPLNDNRLSFKAKGLWAYLMSKPDDWDVYMSHLAHVGPDGKDAIRSGIHELMATGYIERHQVRTLEGKYTGYEYVINENSILERSQTPLVPKSDNPISVKPMAEKPTLLKIDIKPSIENDDVPAKPQPAPNPQPEKAPPSPLPTPESKSQGQTDTELTIAALVLLIPEDMRKPSTVARIAKAIEQGIAIDLIKSCIEYSNDHSDQATWMRYKSHLGQCIDGAWGRGYSGKDAGADAAAREQAFLESRRGMPEAVLTEDARAGCQVSRRVLDERGK